MSCCRPPVVRACDTCSRLNNDKICADDPLWLSWRRLAGGTRTTPPQDPDETCPGWRRR